MICPSDLSGYEGTFCSLQNIKQRYPIDAVQYLRFAEQDLAGGPDARCIINAISNAKRALHLRVEIITEALGAYKGSLKPRSSFPAKLSFCRGCGIASPRIIDRINNMRNEVEHEYVGPSLRDAEDYLDIVSLFLNATERWGKSLPDIVQLESKSKRQWVDMAYEVGSGEIKVMLYTRASERSAAGQEGPLVIAVGDEDAYSQWMAAFLSSAI